KPPILAETRTSQLWAHYVTLDAERGAAVADEVFLSGGGPSDFVNDLIRGYADFLRPFVGKGELATIKGETGRSDLAIDVYTGLVHSSAKVGGKASRVLFSPLQIETRIDPEMAAKLGL